MQQKGCISCSFECENDEIYQDINDRSPTHEEKAQDAPLSSVWRSLGEFRHKNRQRNNDALVRAIDTSRAAGKGESVLLRKPPNLRAPQADERFG